MNVIIKELTIEHYEQVLTLWKASEGVGLSEADSPEGIARFIERNPGLSFVACDGQQLVGVVLCGQDGRRGYIHHLAVSQTHRRQGIGRTLVQRSLAALKGAGIDKCHIFVFRENQAAIGFWKKTEWLKRVDLTMLSRYTQ
jgi:putative acetyltransferase